MAKAFGVEQDIDVGGSGARVNPVNHPIRNPIGVDLDVPTQGIIRNLSLKAKEEANRGLGADIAAGNQLLTGITNPVERRLKRDEISNRLLSKYGAEAGVSINRSLINRQLEQRVEGGNLVTFDDQGNPVDSRPLQVNDVDEIQAFAIDEFGVMAEELPTTSRAGESILLAAHSTNSMGQYDMMNMVGKMNDSVINLDRAVMTAHSLLRDPSVTKSGRDSAKQEITQQILGNVYTALSTMNNQSIFNTLREKGNAVTPAMMQTFMRAYVSDVMTHLHENNAFQLLDMDAQKVSEGLHGYVNSLTEHMKAQFNNDLTNLERSANEAAAHVSLLKNNFFIRLSKENPRLFGFIQSAEGIKALASIRTVYSGIGKNYSMGSPIEKDMDRMIAEVVEGAEFSRNNVSRLQRVPLNAGTPTDRWLNIEDAFKISKETLKREDGMLYLPEIKRWWDTKKKQAESIAEEVDKKQTIAAFYAQLETLLKTYEQTKRANGITDEDIQRAKDWVNRLSHVGR